MYRGGTGGTPHLQVEQIIPHHHRLVRPPPPGGKKFLDPLRVRFGCGLVPPQDISIVKISLKTDLAEGMEGNLAGIASKDADAGGAPEQLIQQPSGAGGGGGLAGQFILDLDQPGVPCLGLIRCQTCKEPEDVGIGLGHAERTPDSRKIMHRDGKRPVQIEYPAGAGKNVMVM